MSEPEHERASFSGVGGMEAMTSIVDPIDVRIVDAGRTAISVQDLVPLVQTRESLVAEIRSCGGPAIGIDDIRLTERRHPLTMIDQRVLSCWLMSEAASKERADQWLFRLRRRDMAAAFSRIMLADRSPLDVLLRGPELVRPSFILAGAFEAALLAARDGTSTRESGGLVFEAGIIRADPEGVVAGRPPSSVLGDTLVTEKY